MAEEQAVQNTESASQGTVTEASTGPASTGPAASTESTEKNYAVLSDSPGAAKTAVKDGTVEEATAGDSQEGGDAKASEEDGDSQTPVEYELELPEGFEAMDDTAIDQFVPIARDIGLDNAQAQKLLNHHAAQLLDRQKEAVQVWAAKQEENLTNYLADREIGGEIGSDAFKAKQQIIKTAINDLPDAGFKKLFIEGNGAVAVNDPGLIRVLYRYGKLISESSFREGVPRVRTKQPGQLQYNASDHANP